MKLVFWYIALFLYLLQFNKLTHPANLELCPGPKHLGLRPAKSDYIASISAVKQPNFTHHNLSILSHIRPRFLAMEQNKNQ